MSEGVERQRAIQCPICGRAALVQRPIDSSEPRAHRSLSDIGQVFSYRVLCPTCGVGFTANKISVLVRDFFVPQSSVRVQRNRLESPAPVHEEAHYTPHLPVRAKAAPKEERAKTLIAFELSSQPLGFQLQFSLKESIFVAVGAFIQKLLRAALRLAAPRVVTPPSPVSSLQTEKIVLSVDSKEHCNEIADVISEFPHREEALVERDSKRPSA